MFVSFLNSQFYTDDKQKKENDNNFHAIYTCSERGFMPGSTVVLTIPLLE